MGNILGYNKSELAEANVFLKNENATLSARLLDLEEEIKKLKSNSGISTESIEAFEKRMQGSVKKMVDDMLENDSVNSSIIPDYIEKKIYTNVFTILIGIMKEVLEDTKINIFNQNISPRGQDEMPNTFLFRSRSISFMCIFFTSPE